MYQKYQTDALVLGNRESGESDRIFVLYTRDFGLVYARATGIRSEKSRMRYALQNYARVHVGLVRGKHGWRCAGAVGAETSLKTGKGTEVFARIARLLLRLVAGEERNPYLFESLAEAHTHLFDEGSTAHATIELVCVARLLYALGYISAEALETTLFTHTSYVSAHLNEAEALHDKLLASVNRAIAQTHL